MGVGPEINVGRPSLRSIPGRGYVYELMLFGNEQASVQGHIATGPSEHVNESEWEDICFAATQGKPYLKQSLQSASCAPAFARALARAVELGFSEGQLLQAMVNRYAPLYGASLQSVWVTGQVEP